MKRLFVILLVLIFGCQPVLASWVFDGSTQYVVAGDGDDDVLTLPNGNWSVFGWVKLDSNSGSGQHWLVDFGGWAQTSNPGFHMRFQGAEAVSNANKLTITIYGAGSTIVHSTSSSTPGTSREWQHIAMVRNGNDYKQYIDAVEVDSDTATTTGAVNPTSGLLFGGLANGSRLDGKMAEWGKTNAALSADQRAMLSGTGDYSESGAKAPNDEAVGLTLSWYFDMYDAVDCTVGDLDITNNGSVTADSEDHPIEYDPSPAPPAPTTPSPANSATGVRRAVTSVDLSWAASDGATGYYVYIGTSESAVSAADSEDPEYKGSVATAAYTATSLLAGTQYFWRIDAYNGDGTTAGTVWNFTTRTQRQIIKGS